MRVVFEQTHSNGDPFIRVTENERINDSAFFVELYGPDNWNVHKWIVHNAFPFNVGGKLRAMCLAIFDAGYTAALENNKDIISQNLDY